MNAAAVADRSGSRFGNILNVSALGVPVILAAILAAPAAAAPPGLYDSGGIVEMLIIGPVDLGRNSGPLCDDVGSMGVTDYLDDGQPDGITEATIRVEEGDQVAPAFGITAGGVGVKLAAPTSLINPLALSNILEVWRADADPDGYINFNDPDNIGDPIEDYIVYSLIYLQNTTAECVNAILEVGSDDAVKMRVNGKLIHVRPVCRAIPGYGAGDKVPVGLEPGANIVLIGVVERAGGTGVRLVVRNPDGSPLTDGRVEASLTPPAGYPEILDANVSRQLSTQFYSSGDAITVTLSVGGIVEPITIAETFPAGWSVTDNGGGTVAGNTITFNASADGTLSYKLTVPANTCQAVRITGSYREAGAGAAACQAGVSGPATLDCIKPGDILLDFDSSPPDMTNDLPAFFDFFGFGNTIGAPNWRVDANAQNQLNPTNALHTTSDGGQLDDWFSRVAILKPDIFEGENVQVSVDITWDDLGGDANDSAGAYVRFTGSGNVSLENNFYFVRVVGNGQGLFLEKVKDGVHTQLLSAPQPVPVIEGTTVKLTVRAEDDMIFGFLDDLPIAGMDPYVDFDPILGCGRVGVGENTNPSYFDNFILQKLDAGICPCIATRALPTSLYTPGGSISVTVSAKNIAGATVLSETFPQGLTVVDAGGGTVTGNTIAFNLTADGLVTYRLGIPGDFCQNISLSGRIEGAAGCSRDVIGASSLSCISVCSADPNAPEATLVQAFAFGARDLSACATFNDPGVRYTMVLQVAGQPLSIAYDPAKGFGYEIFYSPTDPGLLPPKHSARAGWEIFGPMDESPNDRNKFPNTCPEELYDSFIGAKNWFAGQETCNQTFFNPPDPDAPCTDIPGRLPDGIIFRVDVPNGRYRFAAAFGDADNTHAHRILAEDGGEGPPEEIGPDHVVLVHNFDQAQYGLNNVDARMGEGVYARVGFQDPGGCRIPPPGDGTAPDPMFVNMDEEGMPTDGPPSSPILEVTQGYIRIHQLQANSNDGPGGAHDPNGGDAVILELWQLPDEAAPQPPTGLAAAAGDGKVDLSWTAPAGGPAVLGYNVFQTAPGARKKVNAAPVTATSLPVTGLPNGTEHCFVVRSVGAGGAESADSSQACATPMSIGVGFKRGDVDANGAVEITDPINLLGFLFLGEVQPPCFDAADADDNGSLEITDAIVSLGFQFLGDPPPPAPGPTACGPDPTAEVPGADFGCAYPAASCQ